MFGFLCAFGGWSILLSTLIAFVTGLRLLSAGHVRLLLDLELRIIGWLTSSTEKDKHTFCKDTDTAEKSVAGAMGVSSDKMINEIWMAIVVLSFATFTAVLLVKDNLGRNPNTLHAQAELVVLLVIVGICLWMLQAFLRLLRSVGDALDDLVEEMLKVDTFANTSKFFNDPSCLANRFGDRHTSRKLTWVLLTEPATSSTMYQAIGGVVLSGGLVFLPGLLGRAI